jgi:predicted dehydrogenase
MSRSKWTRREVLRTGGAALALPYLIPSSVLGGDDEPGANERVNIGLIGLGGRGRWLAGITTRIPEMQIVAVCDCFAPMFNATVNGPGKDRNWKTYEDFREMCDKEKLDGVMIETTTHARAWVTVLAMQMGLDTYIEKPMALTIREGRQMVDAARRYNCVTQVGTQQRSMPINNWASDLVKNGAIGKVHTVIAPNFVGPERWKPQPARDLPKGGSEGWWDVWTNQAEFRPYHDQIHWGWSRWWDYDGGGQCFGVTGWGTHSYDQIQRALGTDSTGPVEIRLEEEVEVQPTGKFNTPKGNPDTGVDYRGLARNVVGPRAKVTMKYVNGTKLKLDLDGDWGPGLGAIFVGDEGKIEINRNKIASNPKELVESPDNPGPITKPETQYHLEDWISCIKSRERCTADIEYGQRSTSLCYLVNIARDIGRVGETLKWDPETERFTNCDEANKMLERPRRKGYELPELT